MLETSNIEFWIRRRRSVYPPQFNGDQIEDQEIWEILENARWAPTHRMTQPWKFKVFRGNALKRLSEYMRQYYLDNTPVHDYSEMKLKKITQNPLRSSCVIIICMKRSPEALVPEWEEVASVAMAVQNIWLSSAARGIVGYWSTPSSIIKARQFLKLEEGERCLGMFYMGKTNTEVTEPRRENLTSFIDWVNE